MAIYLQYVCVWQKKSDRGGNIWLYIYLWFLNRKSKYSFRSINFSMWRILNPGDEAVGNILLTGWEISYSILMRNQQLVVDHSSSALQQLYPIGGESAHIPGWWEECGWWSWKSIVTETPAYATTCGPAGCYGCYSQLRLPFLVPASHKRKNMNELLSTKWLLLNISTDITLKLII